MTSRRWIALPVAALLLTPLALTARAERKPPPPARQVGEPVGCIPLNNIRETRIRDDFTIDFMRDGKRGWRNTLTHRCSGLKAANAITYETSLNQLCNVDIVYTFENTPFPRRGLACSLGQFEPIELERRR